MRVKNQTQHQRGPRGGGEVEWEVSPHQWDWGSRNEYPPSGMGTVGRDTREPKRGVCVSPPRSRMGGTVGAKMGDPPDVVEFGVKGEWRVIKWGNPHSSTAGTQNGVALATVGLWGHGGGLERALGPFSPSPSSE